MSHLSIRVRRTLLAVALSGLAGCGEGDGPGPAPAVSQVEVAPLADTLFVNSLLQLSGTPRSANGTALTGRSVAWTSSDTAIAVVSPGGMVTGRSRGTATITVTCEGHSAQATLFIGNGGSATPAGQTITALGGAVVLTVPAGAVGTPIDILVDSDAVPPADPRLVPGTAYTFSPNGQTFLTAVDLQISYDSAAIPVGDQGGLRIAKLVGGSWQPVPGSSVDSVGKSVHAPIGGFSSYAVIGQLPAVTTVEWDSGGIIRATHQGPADWCVDTQQRLFVWFGALDPMFITFAGNVVMGFGAPGGHVTAPAQWSVTPGGSGPDSTAAVIAIATQQIGSVANYIGSTGTVRVDSLRVDSVLFVSATFDVVPYGAPPAPAGVVTASFQATHSTFCP